MNAVLVAVLLSGAVASPVVNMIQENDVQAKLDNGRTVEQAFEDFKRVYNKKYEDSNEERFRQEIFQMNVEYIKRHNKLYENGMTSFKLAVNRFADMTHKEYLQFSTGIRPKHTPRKGSMYIPRADMNLKDEIDWREWNVVTDVKDQGDCGSCWSFSTTGAMEGQYALIHNELVSFSEQQMVDCSTDNSGCNGGMPVIAYLYVQSVGGLESENDYPYTAKEGSCNSESGLFIKDSTITNYHEIKTTSEADLQKAVSDIGPVAVAIDAGKPSFQLYSSGIYNEPNCSTTDLNHGVLVVGYGNTDGQPYWIVKNSWGPAWGEKGYIRMTRNLDNQCGIATQASYPDME